MAVVPGQIEEGQDVECGLGFRAKLGSGSRSAGSTTVGSTDGHVSSVASGMGSSSSRPSTATEAGPPGYRYVVRRAGDTLSRPPGAAYL